MRRRQPGKLPPVAFPDQSLEGLIDRMMAANVARLQVVSRADATRVGYIGWRDVIRVRFRDREQETSRTTFYQVRRSRTLDGIDSATRSARDKLAS